MNKLNKALYVVGHSYAFMRSKTGGFIGSAKGVIEGLCEHGYNIHIVSDTLLPGYESIENEQ